MAKPLETRKSYSRLVQDCPLSWSAQIKRDDDLCRINATSSIFQDFGSARENGGPLLEVVSRCEKNEETLKRGHQEQHE